MLLILLILLLLWLILPMIGSAMKALKACANGDGRPERRTNG